MRHERSSWHCGLTVGALLLALAAGATAQAPAVSATGTSTWTPPLTLWGDPNLQGNFTNKDATAPFERPVELGTREFLTDEEFAERDKRAQEQAKQRSCRTVEEASVKC